MQTPIDVFLFIPVEKAIRVARFVTGWSHSQLWRNVACLGYLGMAWWSLRYTAFVPFVVAWGFSMVNKIFNNHLVPLESMANSRQQAVANERKVDWACSFCRLLNFCLLLVAGLFMPAVDSRFFIVAWPVVIAADYIGASDVYPHTGRTLKSWLRDRFTVFVLNPAQEGV